jgi:hypothetical protein
MFTNLTRDELAEWLQNERPHGGARFRDGVGGSARGGVAPGSACDLATWLSRRGVSGIWAVA